MHFTHRHFSTVLPALAESDPKIGALISLERERLQNGIELIASENIVSTAVLEAQGSILTNKYAEGYPGRRYYGGCAFVDEVESLAIDRAKALFGCEFVNVQPHSGSQANFAVFCALLNPGDCFLGMDLACGGHLTHGLKVNFSGKWFAPVPYYVDAKTHRIDMDEVERLAHQHKPKIIIAGASSYSRTLDFKRFREIADSCGAYLMVDMAHIAGLVAAGVHPSPLPYAHVVTTTTHKTLRGPRGGMILTNDQTIAKKINSAIFPGSQGGPLMHVIAAKAVAFKEAMSDSFKSYSRAVVQNAQTFAETFIRLGYPVVSGGTDNHLLVLDLSQKGITGKDAEAVLQELDITCNKNTIPRDPQSPTITSGIRLGTPACTSRGFEEKDFVRVAELIVMALDSKAKTGSLTDEVLGTVRFGVAELVKAYPIYMTSP